MKHRLAVILTMIALAVAAILPVTTSRITPDYKFKHSKTMKKLLLVIAALTIVYIVYTYAKEGTKLDNPKIFYVEDKDASYTVSIDKTSGYFYLEGNNNYPDRKRFRIAIAKSPLDLNGWVGKRVTIHGYTTMTDYQDLPCRKDWSKWCAKNKSGFVPAVHIEKLEEL